MICHINNLLNGMSLISFTHIQWGHRLFHRGLAKTGSSLVTFRTEVGISSCHINMGTSFITSKYFFFKRHLSSGRCRYCFLETQPNTLINYTCWKKTSFPPKSKFSWNFILFAYIPIRKEIFVQSFVLPAKLADENSLLGSDDGRPEFFSYEGEIQMKCLQPASGGDGGNS